MQHNIEDRDKLTTLEAAWKQVEATTANQVDTVAVEMLNAIPLENMKLVGTKETNDEIEKDNIDTDPETGRAFGDSWVEIEVRNVYTVDGIIPQEVLSKSKSINDIELSRKIASILADENDDRISTFINNVNTLVNNDLAEVYDFDHDPQTGEFTVTVRGNVMDDASSDATTDHHDAIDAAKDPYGHRGLRQSDFI
jgi:hypothetical protein